jgi:tetratricopeptide (TPR) repeat protein
VTLLETPPIDLGHPSLAELLEVLSEALWERSSVAPYVSVCGLKRGRINWDAGMFAVWGEVLEQASQVRKGCKLIRLLGESAELTAHHDLFARMLKVANAEPVAPVAALPDPLPLRPGRGAPADPIEAFVVNGRPFINRAQLRTNIRALIDGSYRVLVVTGPPESGKSHSLTLVRHVAKARGFDVVSVGQHFDLASYTPRLLFEQLAGRLGIDPPPTSVQHPRHLTLWFLGVASSLTRQTWVVIDGLDSPTTPRPVLDVVDGLAEAIASGGVGELRLVLLGYDSPLTPAAAVSVLHEEITGGFSRADLFAFLAGQGRALGQSVDLKAIDDLLSAAFALEGQDSPTAAKDLVRLAQRLATGLASGVVSLPGRRRPTDPGEPVPRWRSALRERAALWSTFAPEALVTNRPDENTPDDQQLLQDFLAIDCLRVEVLNKGPAWRLRDDVRAAVLKAMVDTGYDFAEHSLLPSAPPEERLLLAFLRNDAPPTSVMSHEELLAMPEVSRWLGDIDGVDLPSPGEVESWTSRRESVVRFQQFVGPNWVDRRTELALLRSFVYSRPSMAAALSTAPRILTIRGYGGIGKTALIARFLLDAAEPTLAEPLRFVFLSADSIPALLSDLGALLLEAATQLQSQTRVIAPVPWRTPADVAEFVAEFVRLTPDNGKPLLLVVDDLDELRFHPGSEVAFMAVVDALLSVLPSLRVVVTSRTSVDWPASVQLDLAGLGERSAKELFESAVGSFEPSLIDRIVDCFGTSPLVLTLAARLVAESGEDALRSITARTENMSAFLLSRVIDHIRDDAVRRMLPAALLLRRLSPEVILEVLAEPLDLEVAGLDDAVEYFDRLGREVAIVTDSPEGELWFRPEVRTQAVHLANIDDPKLGYEIHHRAVAYYESRDGYRDRAEELYHRLALAEPASVLDRHWVDEAAPLLVDALDELPAPSQQYLQSKLRGNGEPEEEFGREVDALLATGDAEQALVRLRQHVGVRDSTLRSDREIRALTMLGRLDEAIDVAERWIQVATDSVGFANLALLAAAVEERRHSFERGLDWLRRARIALRDHPEPMLLLSIDTSAARLERRAGMSQDDSVVSQQRVWKGLEAIATDELFDAPDLLRDVAGEIGAEDPRLLQHALEVVGMPVAHPDVLDQLGGELDDWDRRISHRRGVSTVRERHAETAAASSWHAWLRNGDRLIVGSTIARLFAEYSVAPAIVRHLLQAIFREAANADHLDPCGSPIR